LVRLSPIAHDPRTRQTLDNAIGRYYDPTIGDFPAIVETELTFP
jgi:hypothetical protein